MRIEPAIPAARSRRRTFRQRGHCDRQLFAQKKNTLLYICALLAYYAAQSGNSVPTFRDNLSVPFANRQEVKKGFLGFLDPLLTSGPLMMGLIGCPKGRYGIATLLTPFSEVLLEKLTGSQLIKKFSAFYGTRRFITTFTVPATCP